MTLIPFIRASQLKPFVDAIVHVGAPVDDTLRSVHLSSDLLHSPHTLIPETSLWQLADSVSQERSIPNFGFLIGDLGSLDQLGAFGARVCASASLQDAIVTFINETASHQNSPSFWCDDDGNGVWLCRRGPAAMPCGHWQIEQYVISLMIQLVRMASGPRWVPDYVKMQSLSIPGAHRATYLHGSRLYTGERYTGIRISRNLLNQALVFHRQRNAQNAQKNIDWVSTKLCDNLAVVMDTMLNQGIAVSEKSVAFYLSISTRSLQRHLQEENTMFSALLVQAKLRKASERLFHEDTSISVIAKDLGYANIAHFSRAFKRWTGCSPRDFRRGLRARTELNW